MEEQQIQQVIAAVMARLRAQAPVLPLGSPAGRGEHVPEPAPEHAPEHTPDSQAAVPDITAIDIRRQYLVTAPKDGEAYRVLKEKTPARVGIGHAGARYRTATMLRFQADHAAAQAAVFNDVPDSLLAELGLAAYTTACRDRDEFLTRPDLGRTFPPQVLQSITQAVPAKLPVLLYVADGLSSTAVTANARDLLPVILNGLKGYGVNVGEPFFVRYGRVGSMDCLGDALCPEVVCVLLGERPGLVTAESMSAYIAYRPTVGMPESRRTVVANIHRGGTPAVEAGAFIVDLIRMMLEKKVSGLELPI